MTLTGEQTNFYVARKKEDTNEDSVITINRFTGLPSNAGDFGNATKYTEFSEAQSIVAWLNSAPAFVKQDYDYYVIKDNSTRTRLDSDGNPVSGGEDEEPAE